MKKIIIIVLMLLLCAVASAKITSVPKPVKQTSQVVPMGAKVLPKNEAQRQDFARWQQLYGFTEEAHIYYNLTLLISVADGQGESIKRNNDFVNMIMSQEDPNSLASVVVENRRIIKFLVKENAELRKQLLPVDRNAGKSGKVDKTTEKARKVTVTNEKARDPNSKIE